MHNVLDLHIHSKHSRACSPRLDLVNIDKTCREKGIDIVATGDFSYPAWIRSIQNELEEINSSGLYRLKAAPDNKLKFILSTEVSLMYKDNGKGRRIHVMITAPNLESVRELIAYLNPRYNIRADGRPIMGMSCPELVKLCRSIHPDFLIYPAHIWTPWFGLLGSKSGFNSLEECFHEQTEFIYAYETGLSSDPVMNWRLPMLDKLTMLSSSDAHSLANLAREATVFDLSDTPSYNEIFTIIKERQIKKIPYTIEFWPEEGMYHYDGHSACNVRFTPEESAKHNNLCPVCKRPLIIGVLNRVNELATRPEGERPPNMSDYKQIIELDKIIAEALNIKSRQSKKVQEIYSRMITELGSELHILMKTSLEDINKVAPEASEAIRRMRAGELSITPGYDGVYGEVRIFSTKEKKKQQSN